MTRLHNPSMLGICRFDGCDDDAVATIGVTTLCPLHHALVTQMMDRVDAQVPVDAALQTGHVSDMLDFIVVAPRFPSR